MKLKWPDDGSCLHTEHKSKFTSNNPADIAVAKQICVECPVKKECILSISDEAFRSHGVWAGTDLLDRLLMRWGRIESSEDDLFAG